MTVGYVSTNNATRDINAVFNDVSTYASWSANVTSNFTIQGIFFDQTPIVYTNDSAAYMDRVDNFVKQQVGFGRTTFVKSSFAVY